jgi:hypothetical protein
VTRNWEGISFGERPFRGEGTPFNTEEETVKDCADILFLFSFYTFLCFSR